MTPAETFAQYKAYVESLCPKGITLDVRLIHSGDPIVITTDNPYVRAATQAMHDVFDKDTVFIRCGGSIPIVGDFVRELKIPTILMGFGLPDDNLHAPNEKFHLANFHRGIESIIRFLANVGTTASCIEGSGRAASAGYRRCRLFATWRFHESHTSCTRARAAWRTDGNWASRQREASCTLRRTRSGTICRDASNRSAGELWQRPASLRTLTAASGRVYSCSEKQLRDEDG